MIAHCGDHIVLFVNASRKVIDEAHLRAAVSRVCTIEVLEDRALLALQGPEAERVLGRLAPDSATMRFMDVRSLVIADSACLVTRSGYTGEDGFEISVAASEAEKLARVFLENISVAFAGLGARDSLRTEAGLCLYGSDLDENTTPVEAALEWAIQKVRRRAGARPVVSPARTWCWDSSMTVWQGAASACGRKVECPCAAELRCLPGVSRPNPSARSHLEASDLQ